MKLLKLLNNRKGTSYITTAFIMLGIIMLMVVIMSFAFYIQSIRNARNDVRLAMDTYIMKRTPEIFASVKTGTNLTNVINADDMCDNLEEAGYRRKSDGYYSMDPDDHVRWRISSPTLDFVIDGTLTATTEFTVTVPVYFAGTQFTSIEMPMTIKALYKAKFE